MLHLVESDAVNGGYEQESRGHRTADGTYIHTNSNTLTDTIYLTKDKLESLRRRLHGD